MRIITTIVALILLFATTDRAQAQWLVPPTPANRVAVTVTPTVTYDAATGLYTYDYAIANGNSSPQNVVTFALRLTSSGSPATSPAGWSFGAYEGRPIIEWSATEAAPDPPGFVDDGGVPLAAYPIRPGASKSGFRFVSPDPPAAITFYARGEVPIPLLDDDADIDPETLASIDDDIEVDSVRGSTVGPVPVVAPDFFEGGRRPATDAFLVFVNLVDGDVRTNPTSIIVKFGARGETVDRGTFHAELNGVDVTAAFTAVSAPGDLAALFVAGSSPLKIGKNVLLTSISGIVPGTTRTARDLDRVTFTVQ